MANAAPFEDGIEYSFYTWQMSYLNYRPPRKIVKKNCEYVAILENRQLILYHAAF